VKALVTGDRGFLGRHFKAELEARGWDVTGLDIKRAPSQDCRRYFGRDIGARVPGRYDLVVHAAAVVGGREVIDGSPLETAVNFSLDAEMFRWAAVAKPGRVLYLSSSAVYPVEFQEDDEYGWLKEYLTGPGQPFRGKPDQVYGWSKLTGEILAAELRAAGVPVTVVRPFSGYGEDQDTTYPFPAFVERALRRDDPFDIWCGSCVRDFIHVDDVVKGALAVAGDGTPLPVNLCNGVPTSFRDLAARVTAQARYSPRVQELTGKPTGVAYRVGYTGRMDSIYVPEIRLAQGINRAMPWED